MQLTELSAWQLGDLIRKKEIRALDAAEAVVAEIKTKNEKLNAFLSYDEAVIRSQAEGVQEKLDAGQVLSPLAGVPMAVKDNISTRLYPTTCASDMLQGYLPPYDATVIENLQQAGAVITGKTNMDEFAMGCSTETSFRGPALNPWNQGHTPGGSSGGSAAAVAAGLSWYALGSDTGGSIRQPSAYCNLTGLKPSYGLVSRYGLIAYASSLDQIGPMARSARDCAAVMDCITSQDSKDSTSSDHSTAFKASCYEATTGFNISLKGRKIALPEQALAQVDPAVRRAVSETAAVFKDLGADIVPFDLPYQDASVPVYYLIACAEASGNLARYDGVQYGRQPDNGHEMDLTAFYEHNRSAGFGKEVKRRLMLGTFVLSSGYYDAWYLKALKMRRMIIDSYNEMMRGIDAVLMPVTPSAAPPLYQHEDDPLARYISDTFTVDANLTGRPAIAFPCGINAGGLPVGAQLTGHLLADDILLGLVHAYQTQTSHHEKRPSSARKGEPA